MELLTTLSGEADCLKCTAIASSAKMSLMQVSYVNVWSALHLASCADSSLLRSMCLNACHTAHISLLVATDIQHRVEAALGGPLDSKLSIHDVRLVAPNKRMLCLTFHVPEAVAFATDFKQPTPTRAGGLSDTLKSDEATAAEQQAKRQRIDA